MFDVYTIRYTEYTVGRSFSEFYRGFVVLGSPHLPSHTRFGPSSNRRFFHEYINIVLKFTTQYTKEIARFFSSFKYQAQTDKTLSSFKWIFLNETLIYAKIILTKIFDVKNIGKSRPKNSIFASSKSCYDPEE